MENRKILSYMFSRLRYNIHEVKTRCFCTTARTNTALREAVELCIQVHEYLVAIEPEILCTHAFSTILVDKALGHKPSGTKSALKLCMQYLSYKSGSYSSVQSWDTVVWLQDWGAEIGTNNHNSLLCSCGHIDNPSFCRWSIHILNKILLFYNVCLKCIEIF